MKKSLFYCKREKVRLNRQENWISPFLTPKTFDKIVCVVHFLFYYYVGIFSLLLFREKPHTDFCGLPYKIRETFLHIAIGDLKDEFLLIIITICSTAVFVELWMARSLNIKKKWNMTPIHWFFIKKSRFYKCVGMCINIWLNQLWPISVENNFLLNLSTNESLITSTSDKKKFKLKYKIKWSHRRPQAV